MRHYSLNLYELFGCEKNGTTQGNLFAYLQAPIPAISTTRRRPAILIIPGGGYSSTSNREAEPIALPFLNAGYNAFILRYTCAPAIFPVALREACMAMRYIRENAEAFEVDTNMIAAIGFSAGGHLCGTLGTMYDCPEVADLGSADLLRPNALGLCYPVAVSWGPTHEGSFDNLTRGDDQLRKRLSLDALVRPDMPPAFLWHTRTDDAVPCRNSIILANAMADAGVDFSLHIYAKGGHGLSNANDTVYPTHNLPVCSPDIPGWPEAMIQFFREMGLKATDTL